MDVVRSDDGVTADVVSRHHGTTVHRLAGTCMVDLGPREVEMREDPVGLLKGRKGNYRWKYIARAAKAEGDTKLTSL